MGSIYAKENRVVIWFGHDEEQVGPEILQMVTTSCTTLSQSTKSTSRGKCLSTSSQVPFLEKQKCYNGSHTVL
jgi:hypothetical protein